MPASGAAIECPKSMTRLSRSAPVRSVAVVEACSAVIRPSVGKAQWGWVMCPQYSGAPGGEQGTALSTSHVVLALLCRTPSAITPPQMLAATDANPQRAGRQDTASGKEPQMPIEQVAPKLPRLI